MNIIASHTNAITLCFTRRNRSDNPLYAVSARTRILQWPTKLRHGSNESGHRRATEMLGDLACSRVVRFDSFPHASATSTSKSMTWTILVTLELDSASWTGSCGCLGLAARLPIPNVGRACHPSRESCESASICRRHSGPQDAKDTVDSLLRSLLVQTHRRSETC